MLQIIAGSWPIAVMFVAALGALLGLRVMGLVQKNREEDRAYRASQARNVTTTGMILVALCASSLLHAGDAIAADKPIPFAIGSTPIGAAVVKKPQRKETDDEYIRRVSRPYPGKME